MTFFVPLLSDDARDRLWKVHHEHALLAACMLEDYEVGLQWAASVARPAEFGQALVEKRPPGMERDQWIAVLEAERAEAIEGDQRDRAEALSLLVRRMAKEPEAVPYGRLAELAAQVGKGKGEDIAAALQSVTMGVLSRVAGDRREEIDRRLEDAAARISKAGSEALPGRLKSAVRAEMRAQFEAIAAEFADVMVAIPPSVMRNAAVFSGRTPLDVADKLRGASGYPWPETREGLIAFAQEHGRRYFEKHGKWPSARVSGNVDGCLGATWEALDALLRRRGTTLRTVLGVREWTKASAKAVEIRTYIDRHGNEPDGELGKWLRDLRHRHPELLLEHGIRLKWYDPAGKAEEVARFIAVEGREPPRSHSLNQVLQHLRAKYPETLVACGIPLRPDISAIRRAAHGKTQYAHVGNLLPWLCQHWRAVQKTPRMQGESGAGVDQALRAAHKQPNASRGLGLTREARSILCQVNSLARANDEIAADCWRLWLDGADRPDPRPWADILAAGDNKRVVKAERVAFLDWTDIDKNGKPKRKPWKPPADRTPPHDAATPAKTSRPKAGNRAPKAHAVKEKTCTKT